MKRLITTLAILAAVLFAAGAAHSANIVNIAPACSITSTHTPNLVWEPGNVADNDLGPAKGWLGEWFGPKGKMPYLLFSLPRDTTVVGMEVIAASFVETGKENRFLRPREIEVDFINGKQRQRLTFELDDDELAAQRLEFDPQPAEQVQVTITDVYSAQAALHDMVGFQEVRIFAEGKGQNSAETTHSAPATLNYNQDPPLSLPDADDSDESSDTDDSEGHIDADEAAILNLLHELIKRLEQKFLQD